MEEQDWLAERFEENRGHLRAVAYRMLGSTSEADDAVQEAWIRLSRTDTSEVDNLGGWLTTVVGRVCLDMLRSRSTRREEPLDERGEAGPLGLRGLGVAVPGKVDQVIQATGFRPRASGDPIVRPVARGLWPNLSRIPCRLSPYFTLAFTSFVPEGSRPNKYTMPPFPKPTTVLFGGSCTRSVSTP